MLHSRINLSNVAILMCPQIISMKLSLYQNHFVSVKSLVPLSPQIQDRLLKDRQVVHRVTKSNSEWREVVKRMTMSGTTSGNEWQRMRKSDNEWGRVTTNEKKWQRMRKSDNEWHWVTVSESKWCNEWKQHSTLQRMDDSHPFYDKNRYTTSRDGWLQLEW